MWEHEEYPDADEVDSLDTYSSACLLHWQMFEQLLSEVARNQWPYGPSPQNSPEVIEDVFKSYAIFDPRFKARGLDRCPKTSCIRMEAGGYDRLVCGPETQRKSAKFGLLVPVDGYFLGTAAVCHFLGICPTRAHTLIFDPYSSTIEALTHVRRKVRKLEGATDDFWADYPRRLPEMAA